MNYKEIAKREYLRGLLDGQGTKLPDGYTTELLDAYYEMYLQKNSSVQNEIKDSVGLLHISEPTCRKCLENMEPFSIIYCGKCPIHST